MLVFNRNGWNLGAALSLAAVFGLTGQVAQAAMSAIDPVITVAAVNAVATPDLQASPSFVFNFNTDFDLAGFEVTFSFDPGKLSFNAAASTLTVGSDSFTLPSVLAMMEAASTAPGSEPDFLYSPDAADFGTAMGGSGLFTFTGVYQSQSYLIPAGSSVTMTGVFNLLPGFVAGSTPVQVFGDALGTSAFESFDVSANVSAVPEPETWLMLLAGVGVIASRVRRRPTR